MVHINYFVTNRRKEIVLFFCFIGKKKPSSKDEGFKEGGDLLFHSSSTIGANGLNFSVRKGKR